jgi:hypothetical protein
MAAIAQLTAKLARRFWGGGNINPGSTYDLGAELDEIRAKINAIITGSGHLTALSVGGADEAVYGTTGEKAKVNADGVNPLTLEAIKIQDQVTGDYYILTVNSGALTLTPA